MPRQPISLYAIKIPVCEKVFYGQADKRFVNTDHDIQPAVRKAERLWGEAGMDRRHPIFRMRELQLMTNAGGPS